MARTGVAAAELSRVLLTMVEGALASGERAAGQRQAGWDATPGRDLWACAEWNLAALRAWRLELLDELAGADLP
jgi:hypothetical protein